MKFSVVAYHRPEVEGLATGRILHAWCSGVIAAGHELHCWSWSYDPPLEELPEWCTWRPLSRDRWLSKRARAIVRPRSDVERGGFRPPEDAIAVGDDVVSFPAVAGSPRSVMTLHYLSRLDARAIRRLSLREVQWFRAERRVARQAKLLFAYSPRVAAHAAAPATFVPMALPVPPEPVPLVDEPIALMIADWRWDPNRAALADLLGAWPDVRDRVPGARLILAGRHPELISVGTIAGVELVGEFARAADLLARAGVLAFPCPDSSGPKVKVLEALSYGLPVVTTPAGVEGLVLPPGDGAVVASRETFADALVATLRDPGRRARLGRAGRAAMIEHHSPEVAAAARLDLCRRRFGTV